MPAAAEKLRKFIINYLKNEDSGIPDLKLLRNFCKDTSNTDIISLITRCRDDNNRSCLHVAAEEGNFEMIGILLEKLSGEQMLRLLKIKATGSNSSLVLWISMRNGGVTWAMDLAKAATHLALKREVYVEVLIYTCQNDDAQALQLLFSAVSSDTLSSVLSTLRFGSEFTCIQKAADDGVCTFISMLLGQLSSESVLLLMLQRLQSNGDKTALHIACDRNHLNVVQTIIDMVSIEDKVVLLDATDQNENTVLHSAVASYNKRLVLALKMEKLTGEQLQALMVKKNKDGLSAMDIAKQQVNKQTERYLNDLLQVLNVELPLSEQIERLTLQRDKLDNQISQLMIQQQREQQQSQITKHADVKLKSDVGGVQNRPTKIAVNTKDLTKDLSPATPLQMNIFLPEPVGSNLNDKQTKFSNLNELSSIDSNSHINQFSFTADNLDAQLDSEKAPSNLDTKVDLDEVIPPLRGPESILEQQQRGVQEEGTAASILVTGSEPQSAQDNYMYLSEM